MCQFAVFVHLLSAIVWVGGLAFLALVAVPATRMLPQFRVVGRACIGRLLVTGVVVSGYRGLTPAALVRGRP
jgi:putative copper export protein